MPDLIRLPQEKSCKFCHASVNSADPLNPENLLQWAYQSKNRITTNESGEQVEYVEGKLCFYCSKLYSLKWSHMQVWTDVGEGKNGSSGRTPTTKL